MFKYFDKFDNRGGKFETYSPPHPPHSGMTSVSASLSAELFHVVQEKIDEKFQRDQ